MRANTPEQPNAMQLAVLIGLNESGRHIYGGTVPAATVERRRKRNKAARAARRVARRSAR